MAASGCGLAIETTSPTTTLAPDPDRPGILIDMDQRRDRPLPAETPGAATAPGSPAGPSSATSGSASTGSSGATGGPPGPPGLEGLAAVPSITPEAGLQNTAPEQKVLPSALSLITRTPVTPLCSDLDEVLVLGEGLVRGSSVVTSSAWAALSDHLVSVAGHLHGSASPSTAAVAAELAAMRSQVASTPAGGLRGALLGRLRTNPSAPSMQAIRRAAEACGLAAAGDDITKLAIDALEG